MLYDLLLSCSEGGQFGICQDYLLHLLYLSYVSFLISRHVAKRLKAFRKKVPFGSVVAVGKLWEWVKILFFGELMSCFATDGEKCLRKLLWKFGGKKDSPGKWLLLKFLPLYLHSSLPFTLWSFISSFSIWLHLLWWFAMLLRNFVFLFPSRCPHSIWLLSQCSLLHYN